MVIQANVDVFPVNVVNIIATRLRVLDPDIRIFKRPLRDSDGTQCIGVYPITWNPDESSMEMQGELLGAPLVGRHQPTLQRYIVGIQAFVKDTDEEQGIAIHATLSKMIRSLLYGDVPLAVGLNALSLTMNNSRERIQRRGIQVQRFLSNEVDGIFMYLSSLEYFVETETV